jgi:hypothetical protein
MLNFYHWSAGCSIIVILSAAKNLTDALTVPVILSEAKNLKIEHVGSLASTLPATQS